MVSKIDYISSQVKSAGKMIKDADGESGYIRYPIMKQRKLAG